MLPHEIGSSSPPLSILIVHSFFSLLWKKYVTVFILAICKGTVSNIKYVCCVVYPSLLSILKFFYHPPKNCTNLTIIFLPHPLVTSTLLSLSVNLPILDTSCKCNHNICSSVWLISLNIMLSRSFHVEAE